MGSSFILVPWMASSNENEVVDINVMCVIALSQTDDQFFEAYVNVLNKIESGEEVEEEDNEVTPSQVFH